MKKYIWVLLFVLLFSIVYAVEVAEAPQVPAEIQVDPLVYDPSNPDAFDWSIGDFSSISWSDFNDWSLIPAGRIWEVPNDGITLALAEENLDFTQRQQLTASQWEFMDPDTGELNLQFCEDLTLYPEAQTALSNHHPGINLVFLTGNQPQYAGGFLTNGDPSSTEVPTIDLTDPSFVGTSIFTVRSGGFLIERGTSEGTFSIDELEVDLSAEGIPVDDPSKVSMKINSDGTIELMLGAVLTDGLGRKISALADNVVVTRGPVQQIYASSEEWSVDVSDDGRLTVKTDRGNELYYEPTGQETELGEPVYQWVGGTAQQPEEDEYYTLDGRRVIFNEDGFYDGFTYETSSVLSGRVTAQEVTQLDVQGEAFMNLPSGEEIVIGAFGPGSLTITDTLPDKDLLLDNSFYIDREDDFMDFLVPDERVIDNSVNQVLAQLAEDGAITKVDADCREDCIYAGTPTYTDLESAANTLCGDYSGCRFLRDSGVPPAAMVPLAAVAMSLPGISDLSVQAGGFSSRVALRDGSFVPIVTTQYHAGDARIDATFNQEGRLTGSAAYGPVQLTAFRGEDEYGGGAGVDVGIVDVDVGASRALEETREGGLDTDTFSESYLASVGVSGVSIDFSMQQEKSETTTIEGREDFSTTEGTTYTSSVGVEDIGDVDVGVTVTRGTEQQVGIDSIVDRTSDSVAVRVESDGTSVDVGVTTESTEISNVGGVFYDENEQEIRAAIAVEDIGSLGFSVNGETKNVRVATSDGDIYAIGQSPGLGTYASADVTLNEFDGMGNDDELGMYVVLGDMGQALALDYTFTGSDSDVEHRIAVQTSGDFIGGELDQASARTSYTVEVEDVLHAGVNLYTNPTLLAERAYGGEVTLGVTYGNTVDQNADFYREYNRLYASGHVEEAQALLVQWEAEELN